MSGNTLTRLELPSNSASAPAVERYFEELFEARSLSEELHGKVAVSISEAVNNAIQHGNRGDIGKTVVVNVDLSEEDLKIEVIDQGSGFEPETLPEPTAPENLEKETGRGIFIIKNLSDELEFEDDGRKMCMRFSLK
jgi:serine/threonine-protein kinase RsbW